MAPKKPSANQNPSGSPPKKPVRTQQKRDTKHGGRNGKKDAASGSSFFTWFIVIALLGVWTSVAVVWFDLVDYEDVLGKLDAYDADGDGDFDVDDAKILLGLKERFIQPSEDSDYGRDEPADPGYISDQDLADALTDDDSDHTHDYISDQDLADVLEDDYVSESLHEHEIDQDLSDTAEELVRRQTQPLSESVEDFDLEDALDDKTDETSDFADDFNLEDAIDATVHESLRHEYEGQHETLEEGDSDVEDEVNLDTEESENLFEEPIVENLMETLTIEVPDEESEVEFRYTEATTEIEDEPALETADLAETEEIFKGGEELWQDVAEGTEIEDQPTALDETTYEDDAEETIAENAEPEEPVAEESYVEFTASIPEAGELVNAYDDVPVEDEHNPDIVEDDHVHHEETREAEPTEEPVEEAIEETNPNDLEDTLYDYAHETEQGDEQLRQSEEQIENEPREIREEIVVDVRPNEHVQDENTLVTEEEGEQSGIEKASKEIKKEKAKKKKPKMLNKFDQTIKAELNAAEKLRKKGKVEEALKSFESLVNKYPQSPKARYGKAQSEDDLAEKRRSNDLLLKAINTYEEATGLPNVPDDLVKLALQRQANRQQFLGRMRGSLLTLQKLVQRYPDDPSLMNELGVAYLLLGDNNKAKEVYEEVLTVDADNGFAKVHYGFILKTDNKIAESVPYLKEGLESGEPGTDDGRFYFHLGDAYQRLGNKEAAYLWYEAGHKKGHFASLWQRSLYNVNGLKAQPWWTAKETSYTELVKTLEANWKIIRDEGLAVMDQSKGLFIPEDENLRETGDWSQYTLWQRGQKNEKACKHSPRTCSLLDRFPESTGCRRGQIKYSVMHPGTHVWPHTGPTNCRLRMHLGLVIPKEGCKIRCANDTRSWEEGKVLIFDDSFEHEVWQDAGSYRLILIVDVWHPALTQHQRQTLPAI
uniref:Aspartate beta-hydroxylase n=1 Tax=Leptobrachium leishanense TaxID=445787 RepID=A0A8C5Q659_9ANUR